MVILGLGSNAGDRQAHLAAAVTRLGTLLSDMRISRVLESAAMLPQNAPAHWNQPYLNMAVSGVTDLSPELLFTEIKKMERELGRISRGVWGPREIDIDILAMDERLINTIDLTIPHRGLLDRDFALLPLMDVAPDWRYPIAGTYYGKRAEEIVAARGYRFSPSLQDKGRLVDAA